MAVELWNNSWGKTKNAIIFYNVCSCWFYRSNIKKHEILMSTMLKIVQRYKKTTTVTHNHKHSNHHLEILKRFGFASMLLGKTLRWRCLPTDTSCGSVFHDVLLLFLCAAQLGFGKQKPRHSKHLENLNKELSLRYYPWNEDWSLWLLLAATFRADSLENSSTARQR